MVSTIVEIKWPDFELDIHFIGYFKRLIYK